MIVEIKIVDDDGTVLAEHLADACHPTQYKSSQPDKPLGKDSKFLFYGFTYQPHVAVRRG